MTLEVQEKIVNAYVLQIQKGLKAIEDVPLPLREIVRVALV